MVSYHPQNCSLWVLQQQIFSSESKIFFGIKENKMLNVYKFYIQKQTTVKCGKHFHIWDQACPFWLKLIYSIHTALNNTTPKIKHLCTNKAYFLSIIPFCLTSSTLLMDLLLKILKSSYVLSGALAGVWKWTSTMMTIIRALRSHQNFRVSWKNAEGRP